MAQKSGSTKKTASSRNGRGNSSSASKRTSSKAPVKRVQPQNPEPETTIFHELWSHPFGKALYLLLGIAVLLGLDFLISMNHYGKFFTVLGIELIAAMIIGWIIYLLVERRKQFEAEQSDSEES